MKVGRYEIVEEIGRGGAGCVYRARSAEHGEVALKLLKGVDLEARARIDRERRLLGSFTARDGFVPLLDVGTDGAGTFLVMPLLRGGTLAERLAGGRLPVAEAAALGARLARALSLAHARGVVHRDLKPANILFAESGEPLIADLGIAKHFRHDAPGGSQSRSLSATGDVRGTLGYMPNEQMFDSKSAGPPADVFALGTILYEALTGSVPYSRETVGELVMEMGAGRPTPVRSLRPEVPAPLAAAIERALAKEPSDRPDALALARALEGGEEPPRRRGPLAVAAVVLAALVLAALIAGALLVRARRAAEPATPEIDLRMERAEASSRSSDFRGAIADLTWIIEREPARASAWTARGAARLSLGDVAGARADIEQGLALDARSARGWCEKARVELKAGAYDRALDAASRAIELDASNPLAWRVRGETRFARKEWHEAIRDLGASIALSPTPRALELRGAARAQVGEVAAGLSDLDDAIRLAPGDAEAYGRRGGVRLHEGDADGALADFDRSIELAPGDAKVWNERGVARQNGNPKDLLGAYADFEQALRLDPRSAITHYNRGNMRAAQKDREGARQDFEAAVALDALFAPAWCALGQLHMRAHEDGAAIEAYSRAIAAARNDPEGWKGRAFVYGKRGEHRAAIADYDEALRLDPNDLVALRWRGQSKSELGDVVGALADLERIPESEREPRVRETVEQLRKLRDGVR